MPPYNHYTFVELVRGDVCTLAINYDGPILVMHPECPGMASVIPELDAFYCMECKRSGRISGAWVREKAAAHA